MQIDVPLVFSLAYRVVQLLAFYAVRNLAYLRDSYTFTCELDIALVLSLVYNILQLLVFILY